MDIYCWQNPWPPLSKLETVDKSNHCSKDAAWRGGVRRRGDFSSVVPLHSVMNPIFLVPGARRGATAAFARRRSSQAAEFTFCSRFLRSIGLLIRRNM